MWRVGSKVPINVYDGDGKPVCMCTGDEKTARQRAELIVRAVNALLDTPPQPAVEITDAALAVKP